MGHPTNRKRVLCVKKALRERARDRKILADAFFAAEESWLSLLGDLERHEAGRPPDRHRRKLADWAWKRQNLERLVKNAANQIDRCHDAVVKHDQGREAGRLAWMLRELLKQRRRMVRNRRVIQLKLPFKEEI